MPRTVVNAASHYLAVYIRVLPYAATASRRFRTAFQILAHDFSSLIDMRVNTVRRIENERGLTMDYILFCKSLLSIFIGDAL